MPNFEYRCVECSAEFEELLLDREEIEKYKDSHPCPACGKLAPKIMSSFAFKFKGEVRGMSGVNGNSGVHDLDYPSLDKAVARSSEKRWSVHRERQERMNKVRQENKTFAISDDGNGGFKPTDKNVLELRQKAMPTLKKLKKAIDSEK